MATAEARSPAGFLDLPPEIRNHIYRFALPSKKTIEIHRSSLGVPSGAKTFLNLMRVNRQLHAESAPMLYAHLTYEFIHVRALNPWLDSVQRMKQHVGKFTFRLRHSLSSSDMLAQVSRALECLKALAHSLQSVTIVCGAASEEEPKKLAQICTPLLHEVQRADLNAKVAPRSLMNLIRIGPAVFMSPARTARAKKMAKRVATEFKAELKKLLAEG